MRFETDSHFLAHVSIQVPVLIPAGTTLSSAREKLRDAVAEGIENYSGLLPVDVSILNFRSIVTFEPEDMAHERTG